MAPRDADAQGVAIMRRGDAGGLQWSAVVRRVTGHATVDVVLKHYFRPDREQFRAALAGALPDVLTGGKTTKQTK